MGWCKRAEEWRGEVGGKRVGKKEGAGVLGRWNSVGRSEECGEGNPGRIKGKNDLAGKFRSKNWQQVHPCKTRNYLTQLFSANRTLNFLNDLNNQVRDVSANKVGSVKFIQNAEKNSSECSFPSIFKV
jgi:hypothetical protein